ncbi:MAG TPA: FAD-dependent oxidoreductase [Solirubrobacteraceae bacterium]|jgi:sulfide:quinone oxidoreductase|nr:FAD-dependent oxidoreductase [Solirubrobacteraceae bacterium]
MTRVRAIVAGGDVAALETMFALRALAGDRVDVTLIAADRDFEYRPVEVHDPLAARGRVRVPLARLAGVAAAELHYDRVVAVDAAARRVHTAAGHELPYDALVVAERALTHAVPVGAHPLDDGHASACSAAIGDLLAGRAASLAFVEPAAPTHPFELFDLAIDTAVRLRTARVDATLTLVTADAAPLAILGRRVAGALRETLGAHGVHVVTAAHVRAVAAGRLALTALADGVEAERVIAVPRLAGPRIEGLACDRDGFLAADVHGRVPHAGGVFAAGDCTSFPVKHRSIAAQQARVAATAIAAGAGTPVTPQPFAPVLRCILPSRLRWYVDAPLTGGQGDATRMSAHPLWSRHLRFDAPYLAPQLEPIAAALAS